VSPESLIEKGLVRGGKRPIKVLADGDLSKKLIVQAHKFSGSARAGIEKAGGSCEVVTS
jgi:large subunit ribosomal protein L15